MNLRAIPGSLPGAPSPATTLLAARCRRTADAAVALVALVLLAPLLAVIAIAIRLESAGSPIFRQRRLGLDGEPFVVNKFRTMTQAADAEPHREYIRELIAQGQGAARQECGGQQLFKLAVDDRITRVGRILRRWSLDELPQLWNVVRGEMALVGPRPVIPYEAEHYPDWYHQRFAVPPGLTGLWQVSGRNERTYEEMVRLDVEYAQRRSLRLDITILVKTIGIVLSRKGAA